MYAVGVSRHITCYGSSEYTWRDENDNIISTDERFTVSANDSLHHKTYICSDLNFTLDFLYLKFVVNGKSMYCKYHILKEQVIDHLCENLHAVLHPLHAGFHK